MCNTDKAPTFCASLRAAALTLAGLGLAATAAAAAPPALDSYHDLAAYRGYLEAHAKLQQPQPLMGGPVTIHIEQKEGGVHVALPDKRELDPAVFGSPGLATAFGGTPVAAGVPLQLRAQQDGHYTVFEKPTPFGDKNQVMGHGRLTIEATDATATDAATTDDKVKFDASWQDKDGNTYEVRCCKKMAAHGIDYPTFGGVVTNHILHGSSQIGTPLMPTQYAYFAFWGIGELLKNDKVVDKPRLIHGMLTEYVRTSGYELAFDKNVTPTRRHFHLMVPPMVPDMKAGKMKKDPANTGLKLPNGKTLPFWHVMFQNLDVSSQRG